MPDSTLVNLHHSLRQARERWAVFLGAGASYDYGIPTMVEMADILRGLIRTSKPDHEVSKSTLGLLRKLCPGQDSTTATWNIEELLTRLYELLHATASRHSGFAPVTAAVGQSAVPPEAIARASDELIAFMAKMCKLSSHEYTDHGEGQVGYLADFFLAMASFGRPANRLIRVFSTNIDLCVEAAMVRLSQRARADRRPDLILVDGFDSSMLPTLDMASYRRQAASFRDRCAVCYWKLHGSIDWTYSQAIDSGGPATRDAAYSDQSIIVRRTDDGLWESLVRSGALSGHQPTGKQRIVIFPTPAKYLETYTSPYMDMFEAFRRTLEEIELLVCVGTSFPDQHIRSAIRSFVERDNTLLFVIDPHVKDNTLKACFGPSRSVQPVIAVGFSEFVEEFRLLDALGEPHRKEEGAH